ncbi:hypothetical protein ACFQMH_24670 [Streptomyces viridiviolaceus]|uniref:Uncharacterized protein n=1 Tax=Streptomyces viridiviolaceus TaxID=68282 RepID=A0ABW2E908_9ACTN|nr:hypothetical protein [Streptomyces viridiviolaceus]
MLPTRRRAYRRDADGHPVLDQVMVSIDLSDVHFSRPHESTWPMRRQPRSMRLSGARDAM